MPSTKAMWEQVDVSAADGGLVSLFDLTEVHAALELAEGCGNAEAKKRVQVDNLKTAWDVGKAAWDQQQAPKDPGAGEKDEDVERSLPEGVQEEMETNWNNYYHLNPSDHLDPAFVLTNRFHREFRAQKFTVLSLLRMITKLVESTPQEHKEKIPMGGEWNLERSRLPYMIIQSVLDGYWALRVQAYAMAKAGNFQVDSKLYPGTKVLFFPLEVGLDYADRALRYVYKNNIPPKEALRWMARNDKLTRTCASRLVFKGWPGGEAFTTAIDKTQGSWNSVRINGEAAHTVVAPDEEVDVELDPQNMEDDLLLSMMDENAEEDERLYKPSRVRPVKKLGKLAMKTARQTRTSKANGKGGKLGKGKGGKPGRSKIGNLAAFWPGSKGARPLCPAYNSKKRCRKRNRAASLAAS